MPKPLCCDRTRSLASRGAHVVALLLLVSAPPARADSGDFVVNAGQSSVSYHLVHKMHEITGVSRQLAGKARLVDGKAQVMLRIPVASFDSGNVNRDAHMKETVEAARYPQIELKAIGEAIPPVTFPTTTQARLEGQLDFHGVRQPLDFPVTLVWQSPTRVRAQTRLIISLDAFKVARPSLMFVKVDDALALTADLALEGQWTKAAPVAAAAAIPPVTAQVATAQPRARRHHRAAPRSSSR